MAPTNYLTIPVFLFQIRYIISETLLHVCFPFHLYATNLFSFFYTILPPPQKKDVVRLWKMHDAIVTVDFSSPSKRDFMEMLASTASSPVFLRCDEGVKWLIRLFSCPSLIGPLHKEIRLAIPECTHAQSAKYGEIYFKAWKVSQGDVKKVSFTSETWEE